MGWTNPEVIGAIVGGIALLVAFVLIEKRVAEPMFQLGLFKIRAFAAGSAAGLIAAAARGGLQFMLIIWLQGIWLPLHGYSYSETPLWAGIYLLPLTTAFLISGPVCGILSDRFGARGFATAGMLVFAASFIGLMLLPVDFPYWAFASLITLNGIGAGALSSLPPAHQHVLTDTDFFPRLIAAAFHHGLVVPCSASPPACRCSPPSPRLLRGGRYVHAERPRPPDRNST